MRLSTLPLELPTYNEYKRTSPLLSLRTADASGLCWAQTQVERYHYLQKSVDPRCNPFAYIVLLGEMRVGCLIFGRPQASKVRGWYGSLGDIAAGTCSLSYWQILNLARVWLDPCVQVGGSCCYAHYLPGFFDRKQQWHSTLASTVILWSLDVVVYDYLMHYSPVWMEEPYEICHVMSYCNSSKHRGTLYQAANFHLVRLNANGIATYRSAVRRLTVVEQENIAHRSFADPRARRLRALRSASHYYQLRLEDMFQ